MLALLYKVFSNPGAWRTANKRLLHKDFSTCACWYVCVSGFLCGHARMLNHRSVAAALVVAIVAPLFSVEGPVTVVKCEPLFLPGCRVDHGCDLVEHAHA